MIYGVQSDGNHTEWQLNGQPLVTTAQMKGGKMASLDELLAQNKLVIKVQTFPFDRAAEAYRISQSGHVRGKLVLIP
jgi:D-arabinose 1-dehydrogenase-like Zn-dependent alcohol dehydrogenase